MNEPVLMKLYSFVHLVYDLRMCVKEDNPGPKYFKGCNSREIISSAGQGFLCDLALSSSLRG